MFNIYIETSGGNILYKSDIDLRPFFESQKDLLDFPGLKIYDVIPEHFSGLVDYRNSSYKKIECLEDRINIFYPKEELTAASIVYMGYILMEKQREINGMVTLHSACVEKKGDGILFLGRSGSGKTTLVTNLCMNYNYNLIGNDRCIIGLENEKLKAFSGTKYMFYRYESVKRNLPHLLKLFSENNNDSWLRKQKIDIADLNINPCFDEVVLKKAYLLHVDENSNHLFKSSGDTPANRLYLNEILSMYIRGIYTTFSDRNFCAAGYIPSYDNALCYNNRVLIIDKIVNDLNLEYVSGNLNDVSNYIDYENVKMKIKKKERML